MSSSEAHQLRNILAIILAGIETGNLDLAKQAVKRAESCIQDYEGQESVCLVPRKLRAMIHRRVPRRSE